MATPKIQQLITGQDNFEIVRDKIAEILLTEKTSQMAKATASGADPRMWDLRVFTERHNPWEEWFTEDEANGPAQLDAPPILNVRFEQDSVDLGKSDLIECQYHEGVFHIECFGYGVSTDTAEGHQPGDEAAALTAQRGARLARQILMASTYTFLDMGGDNSGGPVAKRYIQSRKAFEMNIQDRPAAHVSVVRLELRVDFNEFSPQYQGVPLSQVTVTIKRAENGEIFFSNTYTA